MEINSRSTVLPRRKHTDSLENLLTHNGLRNKAKYQIWGLEFNLERSYWHFKLKIVTKFDFERLTDNKNYIKKKCSIRFTFLCWPLLRLLHLQSHLFHENSLLHPLFYFSPLAAVVKCFPRYSRIMLVLETGSRNFWQLLFRWSIWLRKSTAWNSRVDNYIDNLNYGAI